MESRLHRLVHELPKVDLHRHLEGSVRPGTLVQIARKNGISLPSYNSEELASMIAIKAPVSSLREFLKPFRLIQRCFCSGDAVRRVAYEAVEDAFKDNVRYLELGLVQLIWLVLMGFLLMRFLRAWSVE